MAASRRAGYRPDQPGVADYLRAAGPPRSVYITFDDGTNGCGSTGTRSSPSTHARRSFLISERGGPRPPLLLTWNEISRMAASGRWDFQDHTTTCTTGPPSTRRVTRARRWPTGLAADPARLETYGSTSPGWRRTSTSPSPPWRATACPALFFRLPLLGVGPRPTCQARPTSDIMAKYFVATLTDVSSRR
ncbi:hypothetical protein GXW82_25255 [Streptacidiphilus sp. 4-A2]|nr:hypothetical protein [Streptacidiphilus sp. 4-A2]